MDRRVLLDSDKPAHRANPRDTSRFTIDDGHAAVLSFLIPGVYGAFDFDVEIHDPGTNTFQPLVQGGRPVRIGTITTTVILTAPGTYRIAIPPGPIPPGIDAYIGLDVFKPASVQHLAAHEAGGGGGGGAITATIPPIQPDGGGGYFSGQLTELYVVFNSWSPGTYTGAQALPDVFSSFSRLTVGVFGVAATDFTAPGWPHVTIRGPFTASSPIDARVIPFRANTPLIDVGLASLGEWLNGAPPAPTLAAARIGARVMTADGVLHDYVDVPPTAYYTTMSVGINQP